MHGGAPKATAGIPLPKEYTIENLDLVTKGAENMKHHIGNMHKMGVPVVVAVNAFSSDTEAELELVRKIAKEAGAFDAVVCTHWANGSAGAKDLALAVEAACKSTQQVNFTYNLEESIQDKITAIATKVYGAKDVTFSDLALSKIKLYQENGYGNLPICMAKTHVCN